MPFCELHDYVVLLQMYEYAGLQGSVRQDRFV
jgi:hypothetical protein